MPGYRFDQKTLERGITLPAEAHRGAYCDDSGRYGCLSCGAVWDSETVRRWWPIRVLLASKSYWPPRTWFVEVGFDGIERPIVSRVVGFGRVRVVIGEPRS